MKKLIEINDETLAKLKIVATIEGLSVEALMGKAVKLFIEKNEQLNNLTATQKEDLGLLLLMQQADRTKTVPREDIFKMLE
ncbi:hypothetical protein J2Q11_00365 [Tenacibaculum finnmarkense genomovar finnmarkense]|uniref:hypothetical protein n=1 Tax=Tenacibaculum finnmarkense TaxID=2781243 RepID=UPI001E57F773|nr:hypothetical protein [Tenacibaculum finnmarkense]MCD8402414.1 hypothetical protein [Tenacibaculum finnmarkense genomovar finnmarkense]MCD8412591.1 hypothetical protein [Tenacibaculum finnmarkense genomovar ulcerans]MCD8416758.1 hypothetical protein [Tenacibaculum finnmarkense genomovar finnmarkense]MCD8446689.1 hypothetical protein [Tenacibaculum finnmarkense genomovar finnmarkense]MCG8184740.1 hypothetical protein [Tenacibaculum finnmarkense genomovar finnmarkense]